MDILTGREFRLTARPVGQPVTADFALHHVEVPQPQPGQLLIRNTWMSVDPYMREMMRGVPFLPPLAVGEAFYGAALGEVVDSRAGAIPVGVTVAHFSGWRDYSIVDAADTTVVDPALAPIETYLGVLGTPGLTAYATLTEVTPVRSGDTVFISAAAGAVGSVAGRLARRLGAATVIGSAGGPEKVRRLTTEFGYDLGIDYRAGDLAGQLDRAAGDGIDLYFDNVGGDHLTAAIDALRVGGQIALVGSISGYNAVAPVPGPSNLFQIAFKNASVHGMLIGKYEHLHPEWIQRGAAWLADGTLTSQHTVADGLEAAPEALIGVLSGANTGKMLVRITH